MDDEPDLIVGPDRVFVGRDEECALLRRTLRSGGPDEVARALVVLGEPGMGKTALLDEALDTDSGHTVVVRVAGDEAEAELDYGLIDQMVRATALATTSAADRLSARPGSDPLDVGARLLRVIDDLGADRRLVVVIDDAQVVDVPSLAALTFAARRLHADRFAVVVATRPEGLRRLPPGLIRLAERTNGTVHLAGLAPDAVAQLATAVRGRPLPDQATRRLHAHTDGHPLHTRILVEQISAEDLSGGEELTVLPSLRSLVGDRLVRCSPHARRLLEALSVLDEPTPIGTAAELGEVDSPLDAVEELVDLGLVDVEDTTSAPAGPIAVSFRHDLVRSAIAGELPISRRTHLHQAAAALTSGTASLRHRVAAATGPDDELAHDLARQAEHDVARGARHAAAQHLFSAATLSAAGDAETYVLRGAEQLLAAGQPLGGRLVDIEHYDEEAPRNAVVGLARLAEGRFTEARPLLERAWLQASSADHDQVAPSLLAAVCEAMAMISISALDADGVATWAQRVADTGAATLATTLVCHGLAFDGDLATARQRASALIDAEPPGQLDVDARLGRGIVHIWSNDIDAAQRDLSSILGGPAEHPFIQAVIARSHLADAHLRSGRLVEAADLAELAIGLLDDAQAVWLTPLPHSVAAYAHTAAGDLDRARRHADAASVYARATREAPATFWAEGAWLRIADAEGDHETAAAAGDRMIAARLHTVAEGINQWRAEYVEALAMIGRLDDAAEVLAGLDADTARSGDLSVATGAARARAALAVAHRDDAAARDAFEHGLSLDATAARPLPRARLELSAGAFERRGGRRRAAGAHLLAAARRLDAIGARLWLARCERELVACGLRPAKRSGTGPATDLTPQERVITRLVAEGRSNHQVAAELFVSVKTVEHHLTRIYAKLGVRNRTQMAAAMADTTLL